MNNIPKISAILPVYNGEDHLSECIESVLNQSFIDFEFIIVDDASDDNTPDILKKYSTVDKRIKVITHTKNQKQTAAANTAIKAARSKLIARMDADDIALPDRFFKQIEFMKDNTEVGLVGTWANIIDDNGNILRTWETLLTDGVLKWNLLFGTSFIHSSVMMRTDIVKKAGYYQSPEAEDYDLWSRISRISKVANIPKILQQKRVWSGQLALKVPQETKNCVIEIMHGNIEYLLSKSEYELETIRNIKVVSNKEPKLENHNEINRLKNILIDIYKKYISKYNLNDTEKNYINRDLFIKLNTLARWKLSLNVFSGIIDKIYLFIRFPKLLLSSFLISKKQ